jgi:four helix bundle protein
MGTHKQLEVWKNSMKLVIDVYRQTSRFPKDEIYGLTNQIKKAVVSVPANISEGSARIRPKEFHYFLRVSFGSLAELETLLIIAIELDYLTIEEYDVLQKQIKLITLQLSGLIKAIGKKIECSPPT